MRCPYCLHATHPRVCLCLEFGPVFAAGFFSLSAVSTRVFSLSIFPGAVFYNVNVTTHISPGVGIEMKEEETRAENKFYKNNVAWKWTSEAGSQYRCGRVGRGIEPSSTPQVSHSHTQNASKTLVFALFDSCSWTDGPTDQQTDGPTDGQSLL